MKIFICSLSLFLVSAFGLTACEKPSATTNVVMEEGQFWAELLIMPEAELSEFEKPSDQKPEISILSEVAVGDRIALKLIFSAMERNIDLYADVTFDTEMIRPNGTSSENASQTNLPARQGKTEAPLNVHNSDAVLILMFDPDDQLGTYIINVLVRDNIGSSEVIISKELELIE